MDIIRTFFRQFSKGNSDFGYFHNIKKFDIIDKFSLNIDCLSMHDFFISKTHDTEVMFTKRSRRKIGVLYRDSKSILFGTTDRNLYCLKGNQIYRIKLSEIPVKPLSFVRFSSTKLVFKNFKNNFVVIDLKIPQVSLLRFDWKVMSSVFLCDESLLFTTRETVNGPGEIICVDRKLNYLWTFIFNKNLSYIMGPVSVFPYGIASDNKDSFISYCLSDLYFFYGRKSRTEINRNHLFNGKYSPNLVKRIYHTANDNFMAVWDDGLFAVFDEHGSLINHNGRELRKQKSEYIYNSFLCDNYVVNFCFEDKIFKQTAYIYNLQGKLLHVTDIGFEPFSVSIFYKTDTFIVMSGHIANEGKAISKCCYFNSSTGTLSDFDFVDINLLKNCIIGICMNNYLWLSEQMVS